MPKRKCQTVYQFEELSDKAKDRARDWYRERALDYDWWDGVYESVGQAAKYLGIDLRQKSVKLYDLSIWFNGFYSQGSGSTYDAIWRAEHVKGEELKKDFATDVELHRLADEFTRIATANVEMTANIKSDRDTSINITVEHGETADERINALKYQSPEWHVQNAQDGALAKALEEALKDFNHWIFESLRLEHEYLNSNESVDNTITANEYEFTEEGKQA